MNLSKNLFLIVLVLFSAVSAAQDIQLRPRDWGGDFIDQVSLEADGFFMNLRYERSYHELENSVWVNTSMVSTYPVSVEQYAYFLESKRKMDPDFVIPKDWIPSCIAITESGVVTYSPSDAKKNATGIHLNGAREFCKWLTSLVNMAREKDSLPLLSDLRLTTVGESIIAMNSFVKVRDSEYLGENDTTNTGYVRFRNQEIRSYPVYYINNESFEAKSDPEDLHAGVLKGEKKEHLKGGFEASAGFYVAMPINGATRGY